MQTKKITIEEAINTVNSINTIFSQNKFPLDIAFKFSDLLDVLKPIKKNFDEVTRKRAEELGTVDEDGNIALGKNSLQLTEEMNKLSAQEKEIEFTPINYKDIKHIKIEPVLLSAIRWCINMKKK